MNKFKKLMYIVIIFVGLNIFAFIVLYIMGLLCQWYGIN